MCSDKNNFPNTKRDNEAADQIIDLIDSLISDNENMTVKKSKPGKPEIYHIARDMARENKHLYQSNNNRQKSKIEFTSDSESSSESDSEKQYKVKKRIYKQQTEDKNTIRDTPDEQFIECYGVSNDDTSKKSNDSKINKVKKQKKNKQIDVLVKKKEVIDDKNVSLKPEVELNNVVEYNEKNHNVVLDTLNYFILLIDLVNKIATNIVAFMPF